MTTPTQLNPAEPNNPDGQPPAQPSIARIAPPPKLRRAPLVTILAIAAICVGALVSAWAYTSTSTAQSVIAVRTTVERGQTITAADLTTVKVSVDPALRPLPASQMATVVGKRAALDMPAGEFVTADQVTSQTIPPTGQSIVGVSLTPAMMPVDQLKVGDHVRVVSTPGSDGVAATNSKPETIAATIVGLAQDGNTGNTVVNIQVSSDTAPTVAALASTGKAAVVLDSRDR